MEDSPLSQAITALDSAATDLGGMANVISDEDPSALLTRDEAKQAVKVALEVLGDQCFLSLVDLDFMVSLSDIIGSPHVQIDAAAQVIWYNLVFHGYMFGERKTTAGSRTLYFQCLVAIPSWQQNAKGTIMDLAATSILVWTTIISFDYNLAWKFHNMACRITKQLGMHHLDVLTTKGVRDEELMRKKRSAFWQLVLVDLFFRLCYDRKSSISAEASPRLVQLPEVVNLVAAQPVAVTTVIEIIWIRVTLIVKSFYERLDEARSGAGGVASIAFQATVDAMCNEIEDMIADWHLVCPLTPPSMLRRAENCHSPYSWKPKRTSHSIAGLTPTALSARSTWCCKWTDCARRAKKTLCPLVLSAPVEWCLIP